MRVRAVLQQPRAAGLAGLRHRHGLARPVDDLGAAERERAHGLGVLAVGAADRPEVADVVGAQHGVEGLDAVAEELDPAVVDVVRRARALAAPEVVLGRLVHDLALRRDHEQRVEEAVGHDLGPARLALHDDVGLVEPRELGQPLALLARDVDEELARRGDVRDVEDLVREPGQRALGERDQLHRHVDADDRDRGVDGVLDDVQIALDVTALGDAVDDGREADGHVRRDRGAFAHGRGCYAGPSGRPSPGGAAGARARSGPAGARLGVRVTSA